MRHVRMRPRLWAAPCLLLLCPGCIPDHSEWEPNGGQREPAERVTGAYEELQTTREAAAAPLPVYARVALSEFAVTRFQRLELAVDVYSAESIAGQGLRAEWLGEPGGEPVRASFGGVLAATWSAELAVNSNPCLTLPCVLSLKLAPEGEWQNELSFDMDYVVRASLELRVAGYEYYDYAALDSAVQITLEQSP
jgi:hypothetical protein